MLCEYLWIKLLNVSKHWFLCMYTVNICEHHAIDFNIFLGFISGWMGGCEIKGNKFPFFIVELHRSISELCLKDL